MSVGRGSAIKASGTPVAIAHQGGPVRLERINLSEGHYNEAWLQALAFDHPDILPIAEIEPGFGAIVAVAREVPCSAGFIDNLYVTGAGDLVLVEAKLWRNPQARREVVAQALDYVAALMGCSYEEFENACNKGQGMAASRLYGLVAERADALPERQFVDAVARNLRRGRMLVIALGDGIRSETEALADLLQSHAGAHFTFALVELASWLNPVTQEITVLPSTLARTAMITRGIVTVEEGTPIIKPVLVAPGTKPATISEELYFEALESKHPGMTSLLKAFLARLEPLGAYPDFMASLNLRADLTGVPGTTNFGYITKAGKVWTDTLAATAPEQVAVAYNQRLAEIVDGTVSYSNKQHSFVTTNGSSAPSISQLLPVHEQAWFDAIRQAADALSSSEPEATPLEDQDAQQQAQASAPVEMRLKPDMLAKFELPDILYPLPFAMLDAALGTGGELDFAVLLHALQQRSAEASAEWQGDEPAMARLAELIAPADDRALVTAAGPEWWIEIGPLDLAGPIITIQRGDMLIAAMAAREDGRLRLAAYRPLDATSAKLIINLALRPHPDDRTVCMRPNNWEYALDCSAGAGQVYADARGEPYLSCWTLGIGLQTDGTTLEAWRAMRQLAPRQPSLVAIELGVAYAHSAEPEG